MTTRAQVNLEMPAKAEYLILARLALAGIARKVPMSESVLADLKLAVTEACGNAVQHGNAAEDGLVHVRFDVGPDEIRIEVEDDGAGLPDALDPPAEQPAESGMGVAIIRAIVDELEMEPGGADGGTVIRMKKRLLPV